MVGLTDAALQLVRLYGPLALFCFTFLESSMLFPFLPSEVVVPAAAALLVVDPTSFLVFVLAAAAGGTVGAYVPYYVFRGEGLGTADRIRDYVHVSDERLERGQEWFRRWGRSSVLWGRFLPVLRSVVSIPAGITNMNSIRFGGFTAVGTVGFYAATGGVVYYARERSLFDAAFALAADRPALAAVAVLAVVGAASLVWNQSRRGTQ